MLQAVSGKFDVVCAFFILAFAAAAVPAGAAQVSQMQVTRQGGVYTIVARMRLAVPHEAAYQAATDFARLPEFSSMIDSIRLLAEHTLSMRMHMCVLWFCKSVRQVMRYRLHPPESVVMTVVPGKGDFSAGKARWTFQPDDSGDTALIFHASVTPAFWVPPLIGPWAISRALRGQATGLAGAVEQMARKNRQQAAKGTP